MKKTLVLTLLVLIMGGFVWSQEGLYFCFTIEEHSELEQITRMISIDKVVGDTVFAYAQPDQLETFQQQASFTITLLPLPGRQYRSLKMAKHTLSTGNWDQYPTYNGYRQMMDSLASAYPALCRLDTIGLSAENRWLLAMRITDNPGIQEDEPEIFYTSTIHGDEPVGFVLMLRLIDTLLSSYGSDARLTRLVNELDIYINPNANPDGTYAGGNQSVGGAIRYNSNGADLNRNFPDPEDGPHPDGRSWQPETQAMMRFAQNHHITLSANFHGGTEVANYPWDTWSRPHPDSTWFKHLSTVYAQSAQQISPAGYFTSLTSSGIINGYDWYPVSGGRQDYMTYFHQAREVTLEISDQKLPPADELPAFWQYNHEAMLLYMEEALYGIRGMVTDTAGNPLEAMVVVEGQDQERDSSMVFTDPAAGNYHRMIAEGTYDLRFSALGYEDVVVEGVEVTRGEAVRVDVEMQKRDVGLDSPDYGIGWEVYPNPFRDVLYVEAVLGNTEGAVLVKLFDVQGRRITTRVVTGLPAGHQRFRFSFSHHELPSGPLYLVIETNRGRFTRKVLHLD